MNVHQVRILCRAYRVTAHVQRWVRGVRAGSRTKRSTNRYAHEKGGDEMLRNATDEWALSDLTGQQETVLTALLTGNSITAAAGHASPHDVRHGHVVTDGRISDIPTGMRTGDSPGIAGSMRGDSCGMHGLSCHHHCTRAPQLIRRGMLPGVRCRLRGIMRRPIVAPTRGIEVEPATAMRISPCAAQGGGRRERRVVPALRGGPGGTPRP